MSNQAPSLPLSDRAFCPYCRGKALVSRKWSYRSSGLLGDAAGKAIEKMKASGCEACSIIAAGLLATYPTIFRDGTQTALVAIYGCNQPGSIQVEISSAYEKCLNIDIYSLHGDRWPFVVPLDHELLHASLPVVGTNFHGTAVTAGHLTMWNFLLKCYHDCLGTHTLCIKDQDPHWVPKRLIALAQRDGTVITRLIETSKASLYGPYLTLSYCWGGQLPLRTLGKNIERHKKGIPLQRYPPCFQDCINTALKLDIHYIWIDSLCIIQDDKEDWATQAPAMHQIFANARVTIRAAESDNSNIPFLGKTAPSARAEFQSIELKGEGIDPADQLYARRSTIGAFGLIYNDENTPLRKRAWAWQENALSTRTITFYKAAAVWRCKSLVKSECGSTFHNLAPLVGPHPTESEELLDFQERSSREGTFAPTISCKGWRRIVEEYSLCELTHHSDRLPALSGTAARYNNVLDDKYVAGIWQEDLVCGLSWHGWSWASVDAPVEYPREDDEWVLEDACASILNIDCHPISASNIYGEVRQGSSITLSAPLVQGIMEVDELDNAVVTIGKSSLLPVILDNELEIPGQTLDDSVLVSHGCDCSGIFRRAVFCAKIVADSEHGFGALVLIKSFEHEDGYQRIGYFDTEIPRRFAHGEFTPWSNVRDLRIDGPEYDYFGEGEICTIKIY